VLGGGTADVDIVNGVEILGTGEVIDSPKGFGEDGLIGLSITRPSSMRDPFLAAADDGLEDGGGGGAKKGNALVGLGGGSN
jgi:hypothetical protein